MALASSARLCGRRGAATWGQPLPQLAACLPLFSPLSPSPSLPLLESGGHSPSSPSSPSSEDPLHTPSLTRAPPSSSCVGPTNRLVREYHGSSAYSACSAVSGPLSARDGYSWASCQLLGGPRNLSCSAPGSQVVAVQTSPELESTIADTAPDRLIVVDFTAGWCRPCQVIGPFLDDLSQKLTDVVFLKVDIDAPELKDAVDKAGISAVPTFHFYKGAKLISTFTGADQQKLHDTIQVLNKA